MHCVVRNLSSCIIGCYGHRKARKTDAHRPILALLFLFHASLEPDFLLLDAKIRSSSIFLLQEPDAVLLSLHTMSPLLIFMQHPYISIEEEIELDMLRWKEILQRAEVVVRDRGWSESDEDFQIQIEEEAKHQWSEDCEQERRFEREQEIEEELLWEKHLRQLHRKHSPVLP